MGLSSMAVAVYLCQPAMVEAAVLSTVEAVLGDPAISEAVEHLWEALPFDWSLGCEAVAFGMTPERTGQSYLEVDGFSRLPSWWKFVQ
jgi:hypothetical protein